MNFVRNCSTSMTRLAFAFFLVQSLPKVYSQILPLHYYTTKDGLVSNHITELYQNSQGYLWIGTVDGLSVYDGSTFTNYTTVNGLAHDYVNCITESRRIPGTMWIGTLGGGISEFKDRHFKTISVAPADSSNIVGAIVEDSLGTLWCGTHNGLCLIQNGQVVPVGTSGRVEDLNIALMRNGQVCVASNGIVSVYSPDKRLLTSKTILPSHEKHLTSILADDDGTLWLAVSDSTILHMRDTVITGRMKVSCGSALGLVEDHRGNFWCSSWRGVMRVPKQLSFERQCVKYSVANGLQDVIAVPILIDHEENIWIGSWSKGLAKLSNASLFSLPNPDAEESFMAIGDSIGHIWLATNRGLWEVFLDNSGRWRQHRHHGDQDQATSTVFSIQFDPRGRLWKASGEPMTLECFEISHLAGHASTLRTIHTLTSGVDFPQGDFCSMVVGRLDHLWCCLRPDRVVDVDLTGKNPTKTYASRDGLPTDVIMVPYEDRDGNVWFGGFSGGLSMLSGAHIKKFTASDGLPDNSIRSILQDREGRVWVGTRYGGLAFLQDSVFKAISVTDGLLNNAVWSIAEDARGRIWVGTDQGMDCINRATLRPMHRNSELLGERVYSCGMTGTMMWYLTRYGLTFYDYSLDSTNNVPPPIHITGFVVNGKEVNRTDGLEFSHDENDCQFEYVGISLKDEKAVRYEHKLLDVDQQWHSSTQRSVTFAALRPGKYTFEVQAINNDGIKSASPASVSFAILPPYWQRSWFIVAMSIITIALLCAVYRYRMQRVLELERLRLRIASDLHDDVGTNLSSIVLASQIMERKFPLSVDERKELSRVRSTASEAQDMMRDIVWMLNPQNDSLDDFLRKMKEVAARLLVEIPHTFIALKEQRLDRLGLEFKRSVLLIFKETLNNIVRHSSATHVSIKVADEDGVFTLFIHDNGIGFEPDVTKTTGNGLASLRRRGESIGGKIEIVSSKGEGTTVQLSARIT